MTNGVVSFFLIAYKRHWIERQQPSAPIEARNDSDAALVDADDVPLIPDDPPPTQQRRRPPSRLADTTLLVCFTLVAAAPDRALSALQSYASLPYSEEAYHWSSMMPNFVQPIFCLFASAIRPLRVRWIVTLMIVCMLSFSACVVISLQSPNPILKDAGVAGDIFTVTLQTAVKCFVPFMYIQITSKYRDRKMDDANARLFMLGVCSQTGGLISSAFLYLFINLLGLFTEIPQCPNLNGTIHYATITTQILPSSSAALLLA